MSRKNNGVLKTDLIPFDTMQINRATCIWVIKPAKSQHYEKKCNILYFYDLFRYQEREKSQYRIDCKNR